MKRYVMSSMLLMLIFFSLFIGPSEDMAHYSFQPTDEPVITTVNTIISSDVITESVQTVIPKWQTEMLFSPTNPSHILKGKLIPFKFRSHLFFPREMAGFICVVQHQSNYLS